VRGTHDCRLGIVDTERRGGGGRGGGRTGLAGGGRDLHDRGDGGGRLGLGRGRSGLGFGLDDGLLLEPPGVGEAADAVGRRLVDARRVALHPDLELVRQVDDNGVIDAQLSCQLVDPDLLCGQNAVRSLAILAV
jgi:hypothetical protein